MWIFKRGMRQSTPVAKNVSVTELLIRSGAARAAVDSDAPKAATGQRKEVLEELNAADKEALEGLRRTTF